MLNLFKKKDKPFVPQEALDAMRAVDKFISAGTIKVDINKYEAWVDVDLHWNNQSSTWRKNFVQNLKTYIHMRRILNKGQEKDMDVTVFDMATKEVLSK